MTNRSISRTWLSFWFEPRSPVTLGVCRVLFFGGLFLLYCSRDFSRWGAVPEMFWSPIWMFDRFQIPVFSTGTLGALQVMWKGALGMSCIGLLTRGATAASFLIGAYLLGLPHNFGKTDHGDAIVVIVMGIMALSRCDASWSVDRLWRTRHRTHSPGEHPAPSGEYTWPVRMVWLVMALIFLAAGVSKLRQSGLEWITSENLANLLIQSNYTAGVPLTSWGLYVAQYPWICRLLAAATVAFELAYPLALFSRRARRIIVPTLVLIQIGIRLLMGPSFRAMLICNLFWVPWDRVSLPARWAAVAGLIVFARPDWITRLIPFVGSGIETQLFVYLVVAGVMFLWLARESARGLAELTRSMTPLARGSRSLTPP